MALTGKGEDMHTAQPTILLLAISHSKGFAYITLRNYYTWLLGKRNFGGSISNRVVFN